MKVYEKQLRSRIHPQSERPQFPVLSIGGFGQSRYREHIEDPVFHSHPSGKSAEV